MDENTANAAATTVAAAGSVQPPAAIAPVTPTVTTSAPVAAATVPTAAGVTVATATLAARPQVAATVTPVKPITGIGKSVLYTTRGVTSVALVNATYEDDPNVFDLVYYSKATCMWHEATKVAFYAGSGPAPDWHFTKVE